MNKELVDRLKKLEIEEVIWLILIGIIALIIRSMIRDKKNGKSLQCGVGCKHCAGHCHEHV